MTPFTQNLDLGVWINKNDGPQQIVPSYVLICFVAPGELLTQDNCSDSTLFGYKIVKYEYCDLEE